MSYVHTRKLHTGEINPKHCLNEERFRITEIRPRFVSFRLNKLPQREYQTNHAEPIGIYETRGFWVGMEYAS